MRRTPLLEELAGDWHKAEVLAQCPSLHNFHGTLLTNRDMASVSWLASVPYSQAHHSGAFCVNGEVLKASEFKWSAYESLRKVEHQGLLVESAVRMSFEENTVLFKIKLFNQSKQSKQLHLKQQLIAAIGKFEQDKDWDWLYRQPGYPEDPGDRSVTFRAFQETEKARAELQSLNDDITEYSAQVVESGQVLLVTHSNSEACSAYSMAPECGVTLTASTNQGCAEVTKEILPGEEYTLSFVLSFGDNEESVIKKSQDSADNFELEFMKVKTLWQNRFDQAFTKDNSHFSGHLPALITDDVKLKRVYYMGVITLLMLHRTNMPVRDRVYLTGSPRLGATVMFYWDTSMWATVFALLDPKIMKQTLISWLQIDIDKFFGQDMYSGRGLGNMYSASRMNIFKMILTYQNVTGDDEFLNEIVNGETILQHLENMATRWKSKVQTGSPLADYGEAINLLECVPTYVHRVPSFNAANVWMMRKLAELLEVGNPAKASELRAEASVLSDAVLSLYKQGEGVWHSLHRNGDKVEMRHCYDFITVGKFMTEDLDVKTQLEMVAFVEAELLTKSWMRAQSLSDVAAKNSDRADHGPMGAYDAWPAQTIDVMGLFGCWSKALSFAHDCEAATREGNFSQARELFGVNKENYQADVRIADRDLINRECSGGVAFTNTVIETLFGLNPLVMHGEELVASSSYRGFDGELSGMEYQGRELSILSHADGLQIK